MDELVKTNQIWPLQAKKILKDKNISITKLKKNFKYIFFPWSKYYNLERIYYSIRIEQRPLIIFKPISTCEIQKILNFVYKYNFTIRIFNGKHSTQILSPEIMVDLSYFDKIYIDKCKNLVVNGGATQGKVNYFLYEIEKTNYLSHFGKFSYGSTPIFPSGTSASVGVTGISCIGGIGIVRRTFGLTIDYILSFKITLPSTKTQKSKTVSVCKNHYPDLFWALCGGGANNFGIITKISYKILNVNKIIKYSIIWDFSQAQDKLNLWKTTSINRNDQFTEAISASCKNNIPGISLSGYYVLRDNEDEKQAFINVENTLSYLGGNLSVNFPKEYSQAYKEAVDQRTDYNFSIIQSIFTNDYDSSLIVSFITELSNNNIEANSIINIDLMGGAIQKNNTGSFGFRDKNFFLDIQSNWNQQIYSQFLENWINSYYKEILKPENGIYVGFPVTFTNINYSNSQYYNNINYQKLKLIKQKYDPENILTYSGTIV